MIVYRCLLPDVGKHAHYQFAHNIFILLFSVIILCCLFALATASGIQELAKWSMVWKLFTNQYYCCMCTAVPSWDQLVTLDDHFCFILWLYQLDIIWSTMVFLGVNFRLITSKSGKLTNHSSIVSYTFAAPARRM